jgi:hypothetical protein
MIMKITRALPFAVVFLVQVSSATADIMADADRILNWGEGALPALMSPHQATNQFDKYWYRAYGNTDFYAAINIQDKGGVLRFNFSLSRGCTAYFL